MIDSQNPLKQYFRRPSVYMRLPSGIENYSSDVIDMPENGELPIYPMTAIDEIAAKTPDALFNGETVAQIIRSCVPHIKNPWEINNVDIEALLIAIKSASNNGLLEIESTCPKCEESSKYDMNLTKLLTDIKKIDYNIPLLINDLEIYFKPLTYKEVNEMNLHQFELQKIFIDIEKQEDMELKSRKTKEALLLITDLTIQVTSRSIDKIVTPTTMVEDDGFILEYLKNCDKTAYEKIRDHNTTLKSQTNMKPFHITCVKCSNEYDQQFTLNPTDFFG